MRVLCTGASGIIGSVLCRQLEERGHTVERFDLERGDDVLNGDSFYHWPSDAIIHLAAQSGVNAAREHPWKAWHLNVMGTLNALNAARLQEIPIIIASSNHVYGAQDGPTNEEAPLLHLDTYSASKVAADVMARSYAHDFGMQVAVVRNTNCYGPNTPEWHGHIVEETIRATMRDEPMHLRSDGKTLKSYLYVEDVASAYLFLLEQGAMGAYNVSGDERMTAKNLAFLILRLMDRGELDLAGGDGDTWQADEHLDDSKIRALGWAPRYSLQEGLQATIDAMTSAARV
jgi:nucleoside-diphosphate-sugar epimerase